MNNEQLDMDNESLAVGEASARYQLAAVASPSVPPGYKQTEVGVIPGNWDCVYLGNKTIKVGSGITPTGGEKVYKREGRPFLRSQNIGWGLLLLEDVAFIDEDTHELFKATEIEIDDVFINITGASIGRSAIADANVEKGNVNQHVCIIRTIHDQLYPRFLNYFLLSEAGQRQIDSFQAGGNRQGLNFEQIRSFQIAIPSTAEQHAIAAALSDVDALLAKLDQLIAKKQDLKQAAMQQLLTGQTRLPGFSEDWDTKTFGEVFDYLPTATNSRSDLSESGDTYYIHYGDIHTQFHSHLDFRRQKPTAILRKYCGNAALLKNGDWVMADASEDFDGVGKAIEISDLQDGMQAVAGLHTFLLREKLPTFSPGFKGHLGNLNSLHQ